MSINPRYLALALVLYLLAWWAAFSLPLRLWSPWRAVTIFPALGFALGGPLLIGTCFPEPEQASPFYIAWFLLPFLLSAGIVLWKTRHG